MQVVIGDPLASVTAVIDQPADLTADAIVDSADFDYLEGCATGPRIGPPTADCAPADLNGDGSVDSVDFAGSSVASAPARPRSTPPACSARVCQTQRSRLYLWLQKNIFHSRPMRPRLISAQPE